MKNSNKIISMVFLTLGLILNSACSKKDDGQAAANPIYMNPTACVPGMACGGLSGVSGVLINAHGTASGFYSQIDVAFDFIGNQAQFNPADPKAIIYYNGPAALSGVLRISALSTGTSGTSICGAPAGDYMMQTTQTGSLYAATLSNARIAGSGPGGVRLDIRVSQAVLYNNEDPNGTIKGSATNRVFMQMIVDAVNNVPCGLSVSTN